MLVSPPGGTAVVLMHNPQNGLEFVAVNDTKQALSAGYVPVRAAELGELITALKDEVARLTAENTRLQNAKQEPVQEGLNETNCHTYDWIKNATADQLKTCAAMYPASTPAAPPPPSPAELAAQRDSQLATEKAARRQQLIQSWLMLQNMNRPQPYQLPQPYRPLPTVNPNANRLKTNCTTQYVGGTAYTNCN